MKSTSESRRLRGRFTSTSHRVLNGVVAHIHCRWINVAVRRRWSGFSKSGSAADVRAKGLIPDSFNLDLQTGGA